MKVKLEIPIALAHGQKGLKESKEPKKATMHNSLQHLLPIL